LSSKSSGTRTSAGAQEFTYPPAPSGKAPAGAEAALLWKARGGSAPLNDSEESAKREQQMWNKGFEAGKAEARVEYEQRATKLREDIARALLDFAAERETYFHRVEEQVVRLTLAIARKILNREAQIDPLLLTGVLRVALEKVGSNTNTRLRANPADIKVWREYFAQARENFPAPDLIGDPELEPSRCILETELGTTEIGLDTQLKEIEQGFLDLLAQRPGAR
jgi:flagellar assembly protein FliH